MKKENNTDAKPKGFMSRCVSEFTGIMSLIEIHSDYELTVSGCKGIVDYDCSMVVVDTISGIVKISGCCLVLDVFQGDVLIVSGKICAVSFE